MRTEDVEDTSIGSSSASDSSVPRSKDRATKRESDNLPERSGAVGLGLDTVGAKDFIQEVVEKMLEVACKVCTTIVVGAVDNEPFHRAR